MSKLIFIQNIHWLDSSVDPDVEYIVNRMKIERKSFHIY